MEQDRRYQHIKSLYELYEENYKLQDMIQIYQEEISKLVIEKEKLLTELYKNVLLKQLTRIYLFTIV